MGGTGHVYDLGCGDGIMGVHSRLKASNSTH